MESNRALDSFRDLIAVLRAQYIRSDILAFLDLTRSAAACISFKAKAEAPLPAVTATHLIARDVRFL